MGQLINAFWTLLCFAPVVAYWYRAGSLIDLWLLLGLSLTGLVIPARWLQLSQQPAFYEKLGVKCIRRFVQDGDNFKCRKVIHNLESARRYQSTVRMYERFHLLCLIFFLG